MDHSYPANARAAELEALTVVGARTTIVYRVVSIVLSIVSGVLGLAFYGLLEDLQLEKIGGHVPLLTGCVAILPPAVGFLPLARVVSRLIVSWLRPRWLQELATRYELPLARLEGIVDPK